MRLQAGSFQFDFPRPALLMGVLNVTPDSFSDGNEFFNTDAAIAHGLKMAEEGADIIDIGGESTRPRAVPVDAEEELRRVLPVLKVLRAKLSIPLSIDTMKPEVARQAVAAGASIINDVAANRLDSRMWKVVAESGAAYVGMHMQGTPQTMQENPAYEDVVADVKAFFAKLAEGLKNAGVREEQIIFDVGIGFGKKLEHNLELLRRLDSFKTLLRPLLLGVSRKSFLARITAARPEDRLPGSLACAVWAAQYGVQLIRTHDVAETRQALRMIRAITETGTEWFSKP